MSAFIQAQGIFPENAPVDKGERTERDIKMAFMTQGIERRQRHAMIESEAK